METYYFAYSDCHRQDEDAQISSVEFIPYIDVRLLSPPPPGSGPLHCGGSLAHRRQCSRHLREDAADVVCRLCKVTAESLATGVSSWAAMCLSLRYGV